MRVLRVLHPGYPGEGGCEGLSALRSGHGRGPLLQPGRSPERHIHPGHPARHGLLAHGRGRHAGPEPLAESRRHLERRPHRNPGPGVLRRRPRRASRRDEIQRGVLLPGDAGTVLPRIPRRNQFRTRRQLQFRPAAPTSETGGDHHRGRPQGGPEGRGGGGEDLQDQRLLRRRHQLRHGHVVRRLPGGFPPGGPHALRRHGLPPELGRPEGLPPVHRRIPPGLQAGGRPERGSAQADGDETRLRDPEDFPGVLSGRHVQYLPDRRAAGCRHRLEEVRPRRLRRFRRPLPVRPVPVHV